MCNIKLFIALSLLLALLSWQVPAAKVSDSAKIEFSGRMMPLTACQINGGRLIDVVFGNVAVNKIDSGEFILPLSYTLENCGNEANSVFLMFKATPQEWDAAAISSSVYGLGVRVLKEGGEPLQLNQPLQIVDPQHPPKLRVQLVKLAGVELQQGAFIATGTLLLEYL